LFSPVFNLHVQDAHTYFVGDERCVVLAHNQSPTAPPINRAQLLGNAGSQLDKLVAAGTIDQSERDLRIEIVNVGLNHKMDFSSGQEPNPEYFAKSTEVVDGTKVDVFRFKPGAAVDGVNDRASGGSEYSFTACKRASQTLMLAGEVQVAIKSGKIAEMNHALEGKSMYDLYPDEKSTEFQRFQENPKGLDPNQFIPGDRVWMQNHRFNDTLDPVGHEGSNVIYIGKSSSGEHLVVHMTAGAPVETLASLRNSVRSYSSADRADINVLNYKFIERYSPLVLSVLNSEDKK
jgi:hypothetical protein